MDAIVAVVFLTVFRDLIISVLSKSILPGTSVNVNSLYALAETAAVGVALIGGIIFGLIFGIVFAAASEHIPGRSGVVKGAVFGIIMWLLLGVLLGLADLRYGIIYYLLSISASLLTALVFGALLGHLFESGIKKEERNSHAAQPDSSNRR
ncbi:MAG: hypothetical protein KIY12_02800 [Thermoplasmata archaeon]|uniref:Uncharacterized protein n=1 Tax=Candidatus Sysuiplasma superficiale TaxID=2823368 RepID=A0A8J7YQ09_9ARCH|nr:hypothetical protein [Candidatus Sysuiplasma superficiale]MBX8643643.1 hypothetical protein [Candidatus Sysuiplasma superficiale]